MKIVGDEDKVIGDGISREGLNEVKHNEFKVDMTSNDMVDERAITLQAQRGLKLQEQQQSQGSAVCWEQFLHVTSIRVLLVENDDSTRHIVSALLRNCNYDVIEAANGLQAWKIMENLNNHIDLVLTEVLMPCLSGLGLLCKIMSHYARKTIPVIMMSSHDSMGLVFKCLSKGAVDFLVKPIRKNELKILWQHMWRRCHSNSWTKQAVEAESSLAVSPWNQAPECPDSTCAQVTRSNPETAANRNAQINAKRKCQEEEDKTDHIAKEPSLGIPTYQKSQSENAIQVPIKLVGAEHKTLLATDSNTSSLKMDKHQANLDGDFPSTEYHDVTAEKPHPRSNSRRLNKAVPVLEINNTTIGESKELSLKRIRGPKEPGNTARDDRSVLRKSDLSAFSRYNSSSNPVRTLNGINLSSSLINNGQEIAKKESVCDIPTQTNEKFLHPSSSRTGNIMDKGSTTNKLAVEPLLSRDKVEATSTIYGLHSSSAFKPAKIDFRIYRQQVPQVQLKPCNMQATDNLALQGSHTDILVQHPHQHHHHHQFRDLDQDCTSPYVDFSLKKLAVGGPSCASSNTQTRPCEGNPEYHSLNRSASGSNRGSNVQDGSCTAINAGGTNGESDNRLAGKNGSGDVSGNGCGNTIDPSKLARAGALTKLRQKKKDRCFKKKASGL
ncbi:two-component response regulator-like APRR7 isoform X2 [Lycium barbarum]|uniref:two-component response regulator-like APRR7 isoform X2 n=1 Tax=Lycium barbarum TaxID=112863 RepID=UPI00293EC473|nr:two-component response regulator-like APRR7 isoform X2 [Lycium barbarum]